MKQFFVKDFQGCGNPGVGSIRSDWSFQNHFLMFDGTGLCHSKG